MVFALGRIFLHPIPFPIMVIISPLAVLFCQDIAVLVILFYSSSQLLGPLRYVMILYIFRIQSWVCLLETLNNGNLRMGDTAFLPCRLWYTDWQAVSHMAKYQEQAFLLFGL